MPATQTSGETAGERANRLYWTSDLTVDEILGELGIGRGSLYATLRPVPAGATCRECGERLVFANRTHRAHRTARCAGCEAQVDLDAREAAEAASEPAPAPRRPVGVESRYDEAGRQSGWTRWRHDLAAVAPQRAAFIGGAAALGLVVGAAAARAVREHV